ncbi:putative glycoside hydrolase [Ornithinibacillus sp. JPR2-1]|uniref:putative glycoside hydrolase n=1 Tax=Ornithinibacillus sp. JPR2-1 TaxID=2094019 RepID=UPI0031D82D9D
MKLTKKLISIVFFMMLMAFTTEQNASPGTMLSLGNSHLLKHATIESIENDSKEDSTKEVPSSEHATNHFVKQKPKKVDVRGIYLNRTSIKEENVQKYIDLIKSTNLNAAVIDVKDDYGKITYDSNVDLVNQIGADSNPATKDLEKLVQRFKDAGIYTIARIVVFKDPYLAAKKQDYAIKRKDGTVWQDPSGTKWIDPYKEEVWNYMTSIAKEVSESGFDEIQYDYIRFPERAKQVDQEVTYDNPTGLSKAENILAFLKHSKQQLKQHPSYVSADVFGLVTTASDDMGIGQVWENISPHVDYISPMTYPSHYAPGSYGVANPDRAPYDIMALAMKDAKSRNAKLKEQGKTIATIRPWIQDFDYLSTYTAADVQKQIKALEDQGITQYLIWNAGNVYTVEAFK